VGRVMARSGTAAVGAALRRARYEVIPLAGIVAAVAAHVPRDLTVTVTASPAKGTAATLEVAEELCGHGYAVVPHLAARQLTSERELKETVERLAASGVRDVFVVGGDAAEPAGPFPDALSLLEAMAALDHPFDDVGITGYPETHPIISDDLLIQAMWDKRRHATYIVTQVCFRAAPIVSWLERIRGRGVVLPVYVGLPGVADRRKLLRVVRRIGVGESTRFLRRHKDWLWRMGLPGAFDPKRLLAGVGEALAAPDSGVAGFHFFTFNELEMTERWRRASIARVRADDADGGDPR
jgi:methylenetetrahydrofolate reductase (NADPH)